MTNQLLNLDFSKIKESPSWNNTKSKELLMHQIHVYPAKFPSFLVKKAINYIEKDKKASVNTIGDIFCGCGTTALEARLNKKAFWGCDINPVATLISKAKREKYNIEKLEEYRDKIFQNLGNQKLPPSTILNHERLNYWFESKKIVELYVLLESIRQNVPKGKYQNFYLVAFSNILKRTSKWLTKSIKPTIDKNKAPQQVERVFKSQVKQMIKAAKESSTEIDSSFSSSIENRNFLSLKRKNSFLDLLITSPPYVTSYEYADLHQLSTLWLGFVNDYRELRNGTIGSVYNTRITNELVESLNPIGKEIYSKLLRTEIANKTSVLKYFLDMEIAIKKSYSLIKKGGYAIIVIGNTKFKNVYVNNAKYLTQCMVDAGFTMPEIKKRKISLKKLTPYRDSNGKFSNDKRHRKIYSYEFILIAKK